MPQGKGTYGSQVGRPKKQKNSTDNYAQTRRGKGQNSTDNMNDGPIDKSLTPKQRTLPQKLKTAIVGRMQKNKERKAALKNMTLEEARKKYGGQNASAMKSRGLLKD
jgi:hypothetical protein